MKTKQPAGRRKMLMAIRGVIAATATAASTANAWKTERATAANKDLPVNLMSIPALTASPIVFKAVSFSPKTRTKLVV